MIERVEVPVGGRKVPAYAVSGSPALTVTHALLELAERPVGLCVSGVNYGENVGGSIGVSGTIGAALEAANHGIPSIAASVTVQVGEWRTFGAIDWTAATYFTRLLATQVLAEGLPDGVSVLNLNVPRSATANTGCARRCRAASPTTSAAAPIRPGRSASPTGSLSTRLSTGTRWSREQTSTRSSATKSPRSPR